MVSRWLLLVLLLAPALVLAAPPATLGYQARLADASGQPITGTRTITFRLYDVASGGSALWTETQNNLLIDGGNLSVELGATLPMSEALFGRQLYLGVQIQGDSEMTPRPRLTSAPYARRAGSLFRNRIEVAAEGTPAENGTALLAVIAGLGAPSQPVVVQLDAGEFDLGANTLTIPGFVTLSGQGSGARLDPNGGGQTRLRGSVVQGAVVRLGSNASLRRLTVINTAQSSTDTLPPTSAVAAYAGSDPLAPVANVTLSEVEALANGGSATGSNAGAYLCVVSSRIEHSRMVAVGGITTHALRTSCPAGEGLVIDALQLEAASASGTTLRGAELATGGPWGGLRVFLKGFSASNASVIGILITDNNADSGGALVDALVSIDGNDVENNSAGSAAGIWVQSADVHLLRPTVIIDRLRYNGRGIRVSMAGNDDDAAPPIVDASVDLEVTRTAAGTGSGYGIVFEGAGQDIAGARVRLQCGNNAFCAGVLNGTAPDGTVQPRIPTLSGMDVEVRSSSANGDPQGGRFQEPVQISNSRFAAYGPVNARGLNLLDLANAASGRSYEVSNTRIESDTGCALTWSTQATETLSLRLTGSSLTGIFCSGQSLGTSTLRCAGNTRRNLDGTLDFLPTTCP